MILKIKIIVEGIETPITEINAELSRLYLSNPALILLTCDYVMEQLKSIIPHGKEKNSRLIVGEKAFLVDKGYHSRCALQENLEKHIITMLYELGGK